MVDDDGTRWSGTVALVPPLLEGAVRDGHGDRPVSGRILGRRGDVRDTADRVLDRITLPPLRSLRSAAADLVLRPWARISVQAGDATAVLNFGAGSETWLTDRSGVAQMGLDPAFGPWLRSCLDSAERTLRAHATPLVSAITAWEVARLHLLFEELDDAAAAARAGAALLGPGPDPDTRAAGLLLADQLDVFGLAPAAAELRAALAEAR